MDDTFFHILSAFGAEPLSSIEVGSAAGMKDVSETISKLMILKRVGWLHEENGRYTVTDRGTKILEVEKMTRGGMLLTTPIPTEERKAASQPKQEPRTATLLTPALSVWVDRWGNPCVRPIPVKKLVNLKAEMEAERRREFMETLREDPILGASVQ